VKTDKVYLVGFMGAGKTSVGRSLARRLDWRFIDVDEQIEERERQTVSDIFVRHGEPYFRGVERAVLVNQVPLRHAVVATGGGTFVDPQNRAMMKADGLAVWLDVPLEDVIARIPQDGRRPLAADRANLERLFHSRRAAYEEAHLCIPAGRAPIESVVDQLVEWLEQ
jgi:shikimate kinase